MSKRLYCTRLEFFLEPPKDDRSVSRGRDGGRRFVNILTTPTFFSLALHEQLSLWCAQYKRRSILISWKYDEALWEKINCIATSYIFREVTSWEIYEMFIVSTVERFACQSDLQHGTKGSILITWKKNEVLPSEN